MVELSVVEFEKDFDVHTWIASKQGRSFSSDNQMARQ